MDENLEIKIEAEDVKTENETKLVYVKSITTHNDAELPKIDAKTEENEKYTQKSKAEIKTEVSDVKTEIEKGVKNIHIKSITASNEAVALKIEAKIEENEIETAEPENEAIDTEKIRSLKTLGPFIASKDNSQNTVYLQDVPEICKKQPCVLGVDEAGRGPVLGPMVYGIAFCPIEQKKILVDIGCADSKQLTEDKRDFIFNEINTKEIPRNNIGWAVELISPNVISTSMYKRSKCSLNEVSMNSAIGLIHCAIEAGVNIAEVYVDTVGPPEKYQAKLKNIFPQFDITVAKKADSTYPIVSAASICAKVTRDNALKVWRFPEGLKRSADGFGSGYPGDPVTKRFLSENIDIVFGFPRLVRFSWSTAENAMADKAFDVEFDEPDSEKPKYAGAKLTQFFKGTTKNGEVKREPCRFLKERFLNNVLDF